MSYALDRRNNYGENDKSSRKSIRRNKRVPHRANRHREHQILESAIGAVDERLGEAVEERLLVRRPKVWKKFADAPLGAIVQGILEDRIRRGIEDPEQGEMRIRRIRQRRREPV